MTLFKKRIPEKLQAGLAHWLPPVVLHALKRGFGAVHFHGDFAAWAQAMAECDGYDANAILERVTAAALAVKSGNAAYERDSMTFETKVYAWPVLTSLLWAASRQGGQLSVLDFGGSLGSSYYQHRSWFQHLSHFRWSIVEQPNFVAVGREHFEDETLKFFPDLEAALHAERPSVLLVSSVLQYVPEPYETLDALLNLACDVVVLDRTAFNLEARDRLTVQRVGERIYPASYPAWFFSREKLLAAFAGRYRLLEVFETADRANIPSRYEGFLFERVVS